MGAAPSSLAPPTGSRLHPLVSGSELDRTQRLHADCLFVVEAVMGGVLLLLLLRPPSAWMLELLSRVSQAW